MNTLTEFQKKVYDFVAQIPKGKVMTYGQVAASVGKAGAARAVGLCMKHNPDTTIVPCHRVVAADGALTGYSAEGGVSTRRAKLENEGISFYGERVDLSTSLWHPITK